MQVLGDRFLRQVNLIVVRCHPHINGDLQNTLWDKKNFKKKVKSFIKTTK